MKQEIEIKRTKHGSNYFTIYEVRVERHDGERLTHDRFLNEEDAEKERREVYEYYSSIYKNAWILEQIVWINIEKRQ